MNNFLNLSVTAKALIVAAVAALVGAGLWYATGALAPGPAPVACTQEAMLCPDGSYVGRTGPNCEFVCLPGAGGGSGIRGTVMAGPTCPVERNPPDPACADKPLSTNITIVRQSDTTRAVASTQSDAQGAFHLSLAPGDYIVQAGAAGMMPPSCDPSPVTVVPGGYTEVALSCDTGIR